MINAITGLIFQEGCAMLPAQLDILEILLSSSAFSVILPASLATDLHQLIVFPAPVEWQLMVLVILHAPTTHIQLLVSPVTLLA